MDGATWRTRLYRWRRWLIALAVLVALRAALPEVLRRVIVSQASQALHAQVDVGDVSLSFWRGGVALSDVAVRAASVNPSASATPGSAADSPASDHAAAGGTPPLPAGTPPAFSANPPLIAFKRFAVELHYWPLVHKTVQLRDIELVSPRVALDRLADGELNLLALVPKQEVAVQPGGTPVAIGTVQSETPAADTTPAAAAPASSWRVGLDRFVLKDGRLRFRDLMLAGSEPVEIGIDQISVEEIALTPEVYGEPARIHVALGVDEGIIDVNARFKLVAGQPVVTTDIDAKGLPLRRARLYVPKVGWSDLRGTLDLDLTYDLQPQVKNQLTGTLGLRDVAVAVPSLKDVAVGWKSLAVSIDAIDLLAQRAAVKEVALDGANIEVRASGGAALPLLDVESGATPVAAETAASGDATPAADVNQAVAASPTLPETAPANADAPASPTAAAASPTALSDAAAAPTGAPGDATPTATDTPSGGEQAAGTPEPPEPPAASQEPAKPWTWQVTSVKITNTTVRVLSDHPPLDVALTLGVDGLSSAADSIATVALSLAPPQGTLQLDAKARINPPQAFGGTLKIADLALPPLVALSDALPPEALPSAVLRSDLAIDAGLTPDGAAAPADLLQVHGTLGVADLDAAPPQAGVTAQLKDLALTIDRLTVPGVIPPGHKAPAGAALDIALGLTLSEPHGTVAGAQPLAAQLKGLTLTVSSLSLPAALAKLGPADGVPVVTADVALQLDAPHVSLGDNATSADLQSLALSVTGASVPVLASPSAPAAAAAEAAVPAETIAPPPPAAPPAKLNAQLDIAGAHVATAQGKELVADVKAVGLKLSDVVVPGFVAGAPLAPSSAPLTAGATLTISEPKVVRADGKEFSVSAKAISVPLTSLSLPGGPAGKPSAADPLRASFGEIRFDAPAIRVTRTKAGIVLPGSGAAAPPAGAPAAAAPLPTASAPAAAAAAPPTQAPQPPVDLQIQALRIVRGGLEFTDRAVQPPFTARYAPIDVDARNIKYPDLTIKPLKVDISDANQEGKISLAGDLAPGSGALTLKVDQLSLLAFNPYATSYSPYSIADGTLSIETSAKFAGDKYDVTNAITLHQLDLAGVEGDSLFEQNFGVPLTMALALLRDAKGDIDLGIPLAVDSQGNAQIDLLAVVRSALKQALVGAISSPLKLLGVGGGGSSGAMAPAPIAFRPGRAEPTSAGAQSADRLAGFLASRPGMGVDLTCSPTNDDVRWLREQALRGEWKDAGVFSKSVAFFNQRGPRERITAYLDARGSDGTAELSTEDETQLQQWLDERPVPSGEELRQLAAARLAAVQAVLADKGIAASRVRVEPASDAPVDGVPTVGLKLGSAAGPAAASAVEAAAPPPP